MDSAALRTVPDPWRGCVGAQLARSGQDCPSFQVSWSNSSTLGVSLCLSPPTFRPPVPDSALLDRHPAASNERTILRRATLIRRDTLPATKIGLIAGIVGGVTVVCLLLAVLVWKLLYLPNRDSPYDIETTSTDSVSEHQGYTGMLHRLRRTSSPGVERTLAVQTTKEKKEKSAGLTLPPGAMAPAMPERPVSPPKTPPGQPRMPRRLTSPTPPTLGTPIAPISEAASSAPSTPIAPITPLAPTAPDSAPMTPIMRPTSPEPPETPPSFPIKVRPDVEDLTVELLPPLYREEWAERRSLRLDEPAADTMSIDSALVTSALSLAADAGRPRRTQLA